MSGLRTRWRPLVASGLAIGIGVAAILPTPQMSELGRVFPMTSGIIAVAAGAGVLLQTLLRTPPVSISDTPELWRAGLLATTLLLWALVLELFGFVVTSAVALPCIAIIARREAMSAMTIVWHAVAGVVLVGGFSVLLSEVLNVRLP